MGELHRVNELPMKHTKTITRILNAWEDAQDAKGTASFERCEHELHGVLMAAMPELETMMRDYLIYGFGLPKSKSVMGELIKKGLVHKFKKFCKDTSPGNPELAEWCEQNGVDADCIPQSFRYIREKLHVRGTHGGYRPYSGIKYIRPLKKEST